MTVDKLTDLQNFKHVFELKSAGFISSDNAL